jgi:hypothetical protein
MSRRVLPRSICLAVAWGLGCAACDLNPQPLPPGDQADGGAIFAAPETGAPVSVVGDAAAAPRDASGDGLEVPNPPADGGSKETDGGPADGATAEDGSAESGAGEASSDAPNSSEVGAPDASPDASSMTGGD